METPQGRPPINLTLEEALRRLRNHDAFTVLIDELRGIREGQFQAMKGQDGHILHQIAGAISMADDILALLEGVGED